MLGALITHVRYLSNRDDIIVVRRILSLLDPWSSYFGHSNLIIASQVIYHKVVVVLVKSKVRSASDIGIADSTANMY